jgi:transcriptional regulator NrdR family protein
MSDKPLFHAATWVPHTRCPACRSADIRTYGPRQEVGAARVRYHECRKCKALFKSVEEIKTA